MTRKHVRVVAQVRRCAGWSCERLSCFYRLPALGLMQGQEPAIVLLSVPESLSELGVVRRSKFYHPCEVGTVRCGDTAEHFGNSRL